MIVVIILLTGKVVGHVAPSFFARDFSRTPAEGLLRSQEPELCAFDFSSFSGACRLNKKRDFKEGMRISTGGSIIQLSPIFIASINDWSDLQTYLDGKNRKQKRGNWLTYATCPYKGHGGRSNSARDLGAQQGEPGLVPWVLAALTDFNSPVMMKRHKSSSRLYIADLRSFTLDKNVLHVASIISSLDKVLRECLRPSWSSIKQP
eukprot:sb/3470476/